MDSDRKGTEMVQTAKRQKSKAQQAHGLAFAIRELALVLVDSWQAADLRGRLRAWWEVVTGKVVTE
jgi:hypothetical protein